MDQSLSNADEHLNGFEHLKSYPSVVPYQEKTSTSDSSLDSHEESFSNSSDPPSQSAEDVEVVVDKAKKAATFLWILLHAQVCAASAGRCPHSGCIESKALLLHIKTCTAATGECSCPSLHSGCQQARKLLCHYRKCREIRAKQRKSRSKQQPQVQANLCLICTLLHRHDKSIADNALSITSPYSCINPSQQIRKNKTRSKSVSFDIDLHREPKTFEKPLAMPPPPPRSGTSFTSVIPSHTTHFLNIQPILVNSRNRPRAESYDERSARLQKNHIDPTVELEFLKARKGSVTEENISEHGEESMLPFRKRSVSCSLLSNKSSAASQIANCETILEES